MSRILILKRQNADKMDTDMMINLDRCDVIYFLNDFVRFCYGEGSYEEKYVELGLTKEELMKKVKDVYSLNRRPTRLPRQ